MSTFARPPIESMRPVVSFAVIRLLLPVAALAADGLYGWGSNAAGQLGSADQEQRRPYALLATREHRAHG